MRDNQTRPQQTDDNVTVFFDGSCPLCRREIGFYRDRTPKGAIAWRDISDLPPGAEVVPGLDAKAAMARFHALDESGRLLSGASAFAAMWRQVPGFRTAGRMAGLWGIRHVLGALYRAFLVVRPAVQKLVPDDRRGCDCG